MAATTAPAEPVRPKPDDQTPGSPRGDERRRRDLRRMKAVATAFFVAAAVVYALTTGHGGALGYVNAAAEAAMVGALADWFAVTALFRHPLGLRIPHTAIIPTRKDALGRSLQEFVGTYFLTEAVVRDKVAGAGVSRRAGAWLSERRHAERVAAEAATAARAVLRVLRDEDVQAVLEQSIVRRVAAQPIGPPAGRLLSQVVADGVHHRLVDLLVEQARGWLVDNRATVLAAVTDQAPAWSPRFVDDRVAAKVYAETLRFVQEVHNDPGHRVRQALDSYLLGLAEDLQTDPYTGHRAERLKERVLAHPEVRDAIARVWATGRRLLLEAVDDPDGELRRRMVEGLVALGGRLRADPVLQGKVDRFVEDAVVHVATSYRDEVTTVISDTVHRWDAAEASERIELHVGRDLQFIRINGTVVGGLAGLAIHTLTDLLG